MNDTANDILHKAQAILASKLEGTRLGGSVKLVIETAGAIVIDGQGVRLDACETDVVLQADAETFHLILTGGLSPMAAYMGGRLRMEGRAEIAIQLADILGQASGAKNAHQ
ncbi:MAG: SCP2 sterol-binding domain-containing protein [Rhodobacteraceae bacterium]|nr:SCP2 sterol-binding domain-containing protein [Paracoccaceae bacterium]